MRFICKDGKYYYIIYDTLTHFYFSSEMIACFGVLCYFLRYGKAIDGDSF